VKQDESDGDPKFTTTIGLGGKLTRSMDQGFFREGIVIGNNRHEKRCG